MSITIYHNPACGTSRNVLGLIRNSGEEPTIIEYLKSPPSREQLSGLIGRMGISVRDLLRQKGTPYAELGLEDPALTDDQLLDAMMAHPILINRPIVVTPGRRQAVPAVGNGARPAAAAARRGRGGRRRGRRRRRSRSVEVMSEAATSERP